jgi:hypothetical protein
VTKAKPLPLCGGGGGGVQDAGAGAPDADVADATAQTLQPAMHAIARSNDAMTMRVILTPGP